MMRKRNLQTLLIIVFLASSCFVTLCFSLDPLNYSKENDEMQIADNQYSNDVSYLYDGDVIYNFEHKWVEGPQNNDRNLYIWMEYDIVKSVELKILLTDSVKFNKQFDFVPGTIYQNKDGSYYYPDSIELRFYDLYMSEIESSTFLSIDVTIIVDTTTGERISCDIPYNAYYVALYASFYDSYYYDIYYGLRCFTWLGDIWDTTEIFDTDAPTWYLNQEIYDDFKVTGFDSFQGYETVVVEKQFPIGYGYTNYINEYEFDKNAGVCVRGEYITEKNDYFWKRIMEIDDISAIVDDGIPVVEGPALVEVNNIEPLTLSYNGTDLNYDHYNFYKDGVLIETNTAWKSQFNFEVTPIEGNTTYSFEVVDSLGNSNSIDTLVYYIKKAPGFSIMVTLIALFAALSIKKHRKKYY